MKWNTAVVLEAIRKTNRVESAVVVGEGEDYTTQQIHVTLANTEESLWVRGFSTCKTLGAGDDVEVEMVEVNGGYSDGTLANDPDHLLGHGEVMATIVKLGFIAVNDLGAYF